jgi:pyrroloquinoline quinone biosynthesis protein B
MSVHRKESPELYPVSLGIKDDDGNYHLIEASRSLAKQLRLWAEATRHLGEELPIISPISSVTLTHKHLGHIDGIGQFGREVMGYKSNSIRLLAGKKVIQDLEEKSYLEPFASEVISNGSKVTLGKGLALEFLRVPHREQECSETYGIVVRGNKKSILFLPDHDTYKETLSYQKHTSLKEWLRSLQIDVALLDGTFFTVEEVAKRRSDATGIPHPPICESLDLLKQRDVEIDPEVIFVHLNHTNPVIDDETKRQEIKQLGWDIGNQGHHVWEI